MNAQGWGAPFRIKIASAAASSLSAPVLACSQHEVQVSGRFRHVPEPRELALLVYSLRVERSHAGREQAGVPVVRLHVPSAQAWPAWTQASARAWPSSHDAQEWASTPGEQSRVRPVQAWPVSILPWTPVRPSFHDVQERAWIPVVRSRARLVQAWPVSILLWTPAWPYFRDALRKVWIPQVAHSHVRLLRVGRPLRVWPHFHGPRLHGSARDVRSPFRQREPRPRRL